MQWWGSAQGLAWSWTWRPYVGVWILVGLLVAWYVRLARRSGGVTPGRRWVFAGGVASLWIALDWPLGALAAGYLASVHMVQFLLVALIAPPLLLFSRLDHLGVGRLPLPIADRRHLVRTRRNRPGQG